MASDLNRPFYRNRYSNLPVLGLLVNYVPNFVVIYLLQINSSSDVNVFRQTGNMVVYVRFSKRACRLNFQGKLLLTDVVCQRFSICACKVEQ